MTEKTIAETATDLVEELGATRLEEMQDDLDELVHDMADKAGSDEVNGSDGDIDEIHDRHSELASEANNGGHAAQLAFLMLQGMSPDEIRTAVTADDPAPA